MNCRRSSNLDIELQAKEDMVKLYLIMLVCMLLVYAPLFRSMG